jgi:hypothetical protein
MTMILVMISSLLSYLYDYDDDFITFIILDMIMMIMILSMYTKLT